MDKNYANGSISSTSYPFILRILGLLILVSKDFNSSLDLLAKSFFRCDGNAIRDCYARYYKYFLD